MTDINLYRLAPTFLYKEGCEATLFKTQDEVDKAWEDGWFGPPWACKDAPLISEGDWESKAAMLKAVAADPRYIDLKLSKNAKLDDLAVKILTFENEKGIGA